MKHKRTVTLCLVFLASAMLGCNGQDIKITIDHKDVQEIQAARSYLLAAGDYRFRLLSLEDRYKKDGNVQKLTWTDRELKNLDAALKKADFQGFGQIQNPDTAVPANTDEALLVEKVITTRSQFANASEKLLALYDGRQDIRKSGIVKSVRDALDPIRTYKYFLAAEVPPATLRADREVAKADDIFEKSLNLYKSGNSFLAKFGSEADDKMRKALAGMQELVKTYPDSNKIALSAFYIAEIYRHFGEAVRASVWYDRAWQWDPKVSEPARYRAATLYDFNTQVRDARKARRYYAMVIQFEQAWSRNVAHARERLKQLSQ